MSKLIVRSYRQFFAKLSTRSNMSVELKHPILKTTFVGIKSEQVSQFLGIKFASIPGRFERSVLYNSYGETVECTKYGPVCPQPIRDIEGMLLRVPSEQRVPYIAADEFECLNLNINIPEGDYKDLPVGIYIHGGGNIGGANSLKVYDTSHLVRQSIEMKTPIIACSVNYRVNYFGYSWVKKGNNGLHDLVNALTWTKKYISGFGGDPNQMTAFGESTGSVSVDALLQSPLTEGLFQRAILQSGTMRSCPPATREQHNAIIQHLCEFVGCDKQGLVTAPTDRVIAALATSNLDPMPFADDGEFFGQKWDEDSADWIDALMVGDCRFELTRQGASLVLTQEKLLAAFPSDLANAYGLTSSSSAEMCKEIGAFFFSDALFAYAGHTLAQRYKKKGIPTYQYIFDQPNPFYPPAKAHHAVDLLFTFKAYTLPDESTNKLAEAVQRTWIKYIFGGTPFDGKICAFGPEGKYGPISEDEYAKRRRTEVYKAMDKIPLPELYGIAKGLMASG